MTERQRLSYQDDLVSDGDMAPNGSKQAGGEVVEDGTSLQAWRGDSLAVDVRRGVVPESAMPPAPPSPQLGDSLSSRAIAIGVNDPSLRRAEKYRPRSCASNRLLQHSRIQLWKNYISAKRHPGLTAMQMLSFALFVVFLFILQEMGKSRLMAEELHPPVLKLGGVPRCKEFNGAPCTTLIYTPAGHPEVDFIMNEVANEQGLKMGEDIRAVTTVGDGNWTQYWLDHPNQTLAAISFLDRSPGVDWAEECADQKVSDSSDEYPTGACALPDIIRYKLYYNDTTRYSRASRTYTPFYPQDVTREVQRSLDEAILTLRGRHAGYKNCEETTVNVGPSAVGNESVVIPIPADEIYSGARLQCSPEGNNCAYDSPDLEGEAAPAGTIATAHLDPTGEGPDDWYLMQGTQDESEVSFYVGRYDSPDNLGWGYRNLQVVAEFCRPDWRANLTVYTKSMPVVGDARVETMLAETVFLGFGVMFFYCGAVFNYFLLLLAIVREKEHRLRTAMLMMGLSRGSCWISWLIYSMVINSFSSAFCIVAGYICGFQYFYHSNPLIVFLTFWMFSLAMTAFSFFASAIVQTERVAVVIGFLLFVVGTFFQIIVAAGTVYFYEPDMDPIYRRIFYHYPPFNFAKVFVGIGFSIGEQSYQGMLGEENSFYFGWEHLVTGEFPLSDNLFYLVMNFLEYGIAAWYLDYILTSDAGKSQPFYFPFLPSFWCSSMRRKTSTLGEGHSFADLGDMVEQDVNPTHGSNSVPAICTQGLEKVFRTGTCGLQSANDVHALKEFDLTVKTNRVFCLLGPNGAGKSTLLSLLTGLHQASDGDATVGGYSVADEMDAIREIIGVCPQHDILWPDLTAREHLAMFADIKGTPPEAIPDFVDSKLQEILLHNVADVPSGKFSGGMKRRLSIGISSIGDPDIIFMDEPTTGTDPGNRRMIWNLIEKVKQDRCIVLTTHAMDEADLLSDEIGIMLQGTLFCKGNALSLKNEYGLGFRLCVKPNPTREVDLITMIQEHLPDRSDSVPSVVVDGAPGDARTFMVPKQRSQEFARVLQVLEEQIERQPESALAAEFAVSHSTLEEVFMSIVRSQRAQSSVATASTGYAASELEVNSSASSSSSMQLDRGFVSLEQSKQRALGLAAPDANLATTNSTVALAKRTGGRKSQVSALVLKNISFQKRQRCTNCCQIIVPAILLFVVVIIQLIVDVTFEAKSRWEVKRNVAKEVDVENLIPAMIRELELDQTEEYLNDIGQYCYSGQRNDIVELYCPTGNISDIVFASYGQPEGSCGNFDLTPGCHADSTEAVISSDCIGKEKCYIKAAEATFGDWSPAQCKPKFDDDGPEDSLELRVQIACGGQVDPLGGDSTGFGPADAGLRAAIDLGVQNTAAGEELQQLVSVGVSELAVTAISLLDTLIYNDALTTEQIDVIDFGFVNIDTLFETVGVDLNQQVGDALANQMRALNQTIDVNIANLLGRENLTFSSSELLGASAAPPDLNASQLELLEQAGLASLVAGGSLADVPIDVGSAIGLEDGTSVSVTSEEVGQALDAANITLGDLLGFGAGSASQVDLALEIIRNANGTQFLFDIEGDQISSQLDITRQILGTLPVLFGGNFGDQFDADTISSQLIDQLDGAGISSAEVVIENSVESVIANFFQFGNTAPLTPPVMMWSTPKVFSVSPGTDSSGGGVCRDVQGWVDQIDKEVAASKRHIYESLDQGEYNHRMSKDEFAETGSYLLTELPFAAFIFDPNNNANTGSGGHFNYTVQVETEQVYMSWWLPVQLFYGVDPRNVLLNFVDSSIAYGLDGRTRIDTEIQAMDYMFNRARALAVADQLAYILFPFALTFLLPVFVNLIVYEKEAKLRELMKMSGMHMRYYWMVNYGYNYMMYVVVVVAFSMVCYSVQIRLWTQTSPIVLFTLLFLWGHALVSLSFLISTLLDRDLTSSLVGYVIVVAGVLASLVFNATVYYRDEPPMLYMMYAPLAFYRAIFIMTTSCSRYACITLDDVGSEMLRIYFYLVFDTILYWILFLYLDKVMPSKYGVPEHPLYLLKPLMARCKRRSKPAEADTTDMYGRGDADPMMRPAANAAEQEMESRHGRRLPTDETEDSRKEREMMLERNPNEFAVQMLGLHHEYDRSVLANKTKARVALVDLFLSIGANESLALLGPNGAGKSTLISILTGLFKPTSGTANVCGLDIRTRMQDIHKIIGICPQFSILWDTLTCAEHLLFFARLKGVPVDKQQEYVMRTLEKVGLGLAADRLAKNLSGGMRRRLSIAMALVGDPLFLVMDEPTTGLDPETREELWRTLLQIRASGPAILLATHAMDEAELLCSRVSILSRGTLKCVGGPHELRERFVPNYTLIVNFVEGFTKDVVLELFPSCKVSSEFELSASFEIHATEARRMSTIFMDMEAAVKIGKVADWGLVRAGLEGVFLDVVQDEIISH